MSSTRKQVLLATVSVALAIGFTTADTVASAQTASAEVAESSEGRDRHGPPGKGWFHEDGHAGMSIERDSDQPRRYGPPGKPFHRPALAPAPPSAVSASEDLRPRKRRAPPGKLPYGRSR